MSGRVLAVTVVLSSFAASLADAGRADAKALAAEARQVAGRPAAVQQQRQLLQQKIALIERYLTVPAMRSIESGGDLQARALVTRARELLGAATRDLDGDALAAASGKLDEALRALALAARSAAPGRPEPDAADHEARYRRLSRHVDGYLASLDRMAPGEQGLQAEIARLRGQLAEAGRLAEAQRFAEAGDLAATAYRAAVDLVAERGRGRTVVSRLSFENAVEELEYERDRNASYEMLVELMLRERPVVPDRLRELVDRQVARSRDERQLADGLAGSGRHDEAIARMEGATRHLIRALQAGGVPVPE